MTFHHDSYYWSNKVAYNSAGGETGFDEIETKLPTYWSTPFNKICLGMKVNWQKRFIVLNIHASSLHSLIADGQTRNTNLGRHTWKRLIGPQASLQRNCNQEGFNTKSGDNRVRARIGILGNEQNECYSPDSRIGFGTGGDPGNSNTCGNEASHSPDNGNRHIQAMGYILLQ